MEFKTTGAHGIELQEYKGEYSLVATYADKNGKYWQQWGKRKVGKTDYGEKDTPVKVVIGDASTLVKTCLALIQEVTGKTYQEAEGDTPF